MHLIWWQGEDVDDEGDYACIGERRYKIFQNQSHNGLNKQASILLDPVRKNQSINKTPCRQGPYHPTIISENQPGPSNSERCMFPENLKFPKIGKWKYHQGKM